MFLSTCLDEAPSYDREELEEQNESLEHNVAVGNLLVNGLETTIIPFNLNESYSRIHCYIVSLGF